MFTIFVLMYLIRQETKTGRDAHRKRGSDGQFHTYISTECQTDWTLLEGLIQQYQDGVPSQSLYKGQSPTHMSLHQASSMSLLPAFKVRVELVLPKIIKLFHKAFWKHHFIFNMYVFCRFKKR